MKTQTRKRSTRFESLEQRTLLAADLSVSVEFAPAVVRRTEEMTYVLRVANNGPDDAIARVDLPELGLEQTRLTSEQVMRFSQLDALPIEAGAEILLAVDGIVPADAKSNISVSANITPANTEDSDLSNNRADFQIQTLETELASEVDVAVFVERIGTQELVPGDRASFFVRVDNNGTSFAQDVVLTTSLTNLQSATWMSKDSADSGMGPISTSLDLFPGQAVIYTLDGIVGRGPLISLDATVAPGVLQVDSIGSNQMQVVANVPLREQIPKIIGRVSVCYDETFVLDDILYFVGKPSWDQHCQITRSNASSGFYGGTLWRTDGTSSGTYVVKEIRPQVVREPGLFDPFVFTEPYHPEFMEFNGLLVFVADDGVHGAELWRSDGTEAGTHLVKDINPTIGIRHWKGYSVEYNQESNIDNIQVLDGKLAFQAFDGTETSTWISDGTEAGTRKVQELILDPASEADSTVGRPNVSRRNGDLVRIDDAGRTLLISDIAPLRNITAWGNYAIYNHSELLGGSRAAPLYVVHLGVDAVEAAGPFEFSPTTSPDVLQAFATEIVSADRFARESPFNVVGNDPTEFTLNGSRQRQQPSLSLSEITMRFPSPVVDGPGPDITVGVSDEGFGPAAVFGTTQDGEELFLGTIDIDRQSIDLADGPQQGPFVSLKVASIAGELNDFVLTSVKATIAASTILTTSGPSNLDDEYSWDLNNDGVFGDRTGPSIGLSSSELVDWGISQPGEYPISVRRNDRVNDYFDETTFTVLEEDTLDLIAGDIDGNGQVSFADFLVLNHNYGKSDATAQDGDVNRDSEVGFADFVVLLQNYGRRLN